MFMNFRACNCQFPDDSGPGINLAEFQVLPMRSTLLLASLLTSAGLAATREAKALGIIPPSEIRLLIEGQHNSGVPFSFRQLNATLWDLTIDGGPRGGIFRWEQVERRPEFFVLRGTDSTAQPPFHYRVFPDGRAEVNMGGGWVPNGVVRLTALGP
jgi:hypothetical protein